MEEKLQMQRTITQQTKAHTALQEENTRLAGLLEQQDKVMVQMKGMVQRYEDELEAQALSLEAMSEERESARANMQEAHERATALASEVVNLESGLLHWKSGKLKADKELEARDQKTAKLEKQLGFLKHEQARLQEELGSIALEKRNLFVKLKQQEARFNKALEEAGAGTARAKLMAPQQEAHPVDIAIQCSLHQEQDQQQQQQQQQQHQQQQQQQQQQQEQHPPQQQHQQQQSTQGGGEAAAPSAPADTARLSEASSELVHAQQQRVQDRASRGEQRQQQQQQHSVNKGEDPASAWIADRAFNLHALDEVMRQDPGSAAALAPLARWLPAGPISAASPAGAMAEEEVRLLDSIHTLIAQCEARSAELQRSNNDLRQQLAAALKQLEGGAPASTQGGKLQQSQQPQPQQQQHHHHHQQLWQHQQQQHQQQQQQQQQQEAREGPRGQVPVVGAKTMGEGAHGISAQQPQLPQAQPPHGATATPSELAALSEMRPATPLPHQPEVKEGMGSSPLRSAAQPEPAQKKRGWLGSLFSPRRSQPPPRKPTQRTAVEQLL